MEKHFLKMLADSFAGKLPIDVYAVAANSTAAEQVLAQFHDAGISVKGRHYDKGFTEFVKSRLAEAFCGQEVRLQAPLTGDVDEPLPKIVVNRDFDARRSTSHFDPRSNKNN